MAAHLDPDPVASATAPDGSPRPGFPRPGRVLLVLGTGLLVALLVRVFLAEAFFVPSPAMAPTVSAGDRVLVVKPVGPPARGDVVVADVTTAFAGPSRATPVADGLIGRAMGAAASVFGVRDGSVSVISRVVAVGGDSVAVADGTLTVNGRVVAEGVSDPDLPAFTVPRGSVWLLGDNHRVAIDSLSNAASTPGHGVVPTAQVVGRAWLRFWPLGRLGVIASATQSAATP